MNVGMTEAVGFVYTLGVLVTGVWIVYGGLPPITPASVGMFLALTLAWTVYFSWVVVPRIVDLETEDEEEGEQDLAEPDL